MTIYGKKFWRDLNEQSGLYLIEQGIAFNTYNAGAHIKITRPGLVVDFWPGTGLWIIGRKRGRGVRNLVKELRGRS